MSLLVGRSDSRRLVPVVAILAVLGVLGLTGCGSTGASGDGVVTSIDTPTSSSVPLSDAAMAALMQKRAAEFKKAVKTFRACDRKVNADSNKPYACLKKAAAETTVVDYALAELGVVQVPPAYAATLTSMKRLSAAGAAVATKCKKAADQKCDQALARFRADEQSLVWDLDIKV